MTKKEEQALQSLNALLTQIKQENQNFRESINQKVNAVSEKVEKKLMPITFEQNILTSAQQAIDLAIKETLTRHDSPLSKLVKSVVEENSGELRTLISDSFQTVIRTDEFKASIISAFSHKVAKTIISNNDGLFDKVSNELKQDSAFKAKMVVAVSNVVEECLKEGKVNV